MTHRILGVVCILGLALAGAEEKSTDAGRDARKRLGTAVQGNDAQAVRQVVQELVRAGGKKNIGVILEMLPQVPAAKDSLYWTLLEGACSFTDPGALEEIGEAIVRHARVGFSRDLLYGLMENPSRKVPLALRAVIRKGPEDLKLMAVQKIGEVPAVESVDLLIDVLREEEKRSSKPEGNELIVEAVLGLQKITGEKMGPISVNWDGWWKLNRDKARLGKSAKAGAEAEKTTGTVVDTVHLDRKRQKEFYGLEKAPKKGVVVLSAEFGKPVEKDLNNDHIERVIDRMGVPHEVVKRDEFEKYDLSKTGVVVINCAQFHEFCICPKCKPGGSPTNRLYRCTGCNQHKTWSGELSPRSIKKIKEFVARGGYLFCEDWIVKEVLEKAFTKTAGAGVVLRKENVPHVDVVPARGRSTHPYLRGIFVPKKTEEDDSVASGGDSDGESGGSTAPVDKDGEEVTSDGTRKVANLKFRWTIDDESWAFDIRDKQKVLVLMTSGDLQEKAEGQGVVAFAFRPGGSPDDIGVPARKGQHRPGVVLQVLSHFGKQGSTRDEFLLQNLLLNFLIDANVERETQQGPEVADKKPRKEAAGDKKGSGKEKGGSSSNPGKGGDDEGEGKSKGSKDSEDEEDGDAGGG